MRTDVKEEEKRGKGRIALYANAKYFDEFAPETGWDFVQVIQLQKEMLLMGEAQERLQNHLQQQQRLGQENSSLASDMLISALKAELKGELQ